MQRLIEALSLARSLVDLAKSIVEVCRATRHEAGEHAYQPKHLAGRRGGSAHKHEKSR